MDNAEWNGYPQNPERDGWHWLTHPEGVHPITVIWDASIAAWCSGAAHSPAGVVELGYHYLGPCLLPAEVAALVEAARREEREAAAKAATAIADEALGWLRNQPLDDTRAARWNGRVHAAKEIAAAIRARGGA